MFVQKWESNQQVRVSYRVSPAKTCQLNQTADPSQFDEVRAQKEEYAVWPVTCRFVHVLLSLNPDALLCAPRAPRLTRAHYTLSFVALGVIGTTSGHFPGLCLRAPRRSRQKLILIAGTVHCWLVERLQAAGGPACHRLIDKGLSVLGAAGPKRWRTIAILTRPLLARRSFEGKRR